MSGNQRVDFSREKKEDFVSRKINQSLAKVKKKRSKEFSKESDNQNQIDKYFIQQKNTRVIQGNPIPNENQNNKISTEDTVENQNQVNSKSAESIDESPNENQDNGISTEHPNQANSKSAESIDESTAVNNRLRNEIKVLTKTLSAAKSLLRKTNHVNMQKDLQIKKLTTQSEAEKKSDHLFNEFSLIFEKCELATIRSVGPGQKNDSRFILNIMRFLYKGDETEKLKNRSVNGRKYKGENKLEISFEKKQMLETMFKQRVDDECSEMSQLIVTNEHSKRIKTVGNLIRSAIHNILKGVRKDENRKRARDEDVDDFSSSKYARTNEGKQRNLRLQKKKSKLRIFFCF